MAKYRFNANKIARIRKKMSLSRYKFGIEVGTSSNVVKGWEGGTTMPSITTLIALCEKFDLEPNNFFLRK